MGGRIRARCRRDRRRSALQKAPGKAPPSMRKFWPVMNPAARWQGRRRARQTRPDRQIARPGFRFPFRPRFIHADPPLRRRAGEAGFLPVGLERSGLDRIDRHVVAREEPRCGRENAVRPARAPEETSRPAIGARTELEVMLMMRPTCARPCPAPAPGPVRSGSACSTRRPRISSRVISANALNGGPPLLLTRMSASGQAAISSAHAPDRRDRQELANLDARRLRRNSAAVRSRERLVPSVEHDRASRFRQRPGAGAAQAFARRANDRFPAGNSQVHCGAPALDTLQARQL